VLDVVVDVSGFATHALTRAARSQPDPTRPTHDDQLRRIGGRAVSGGSRCPEERARGQEATEASASTRSLLDSSEVGAGVDIAPMYNSMAA
jgi:hypothetical protein